MNVYMPEAVLKSAMISLSVKGRSEDENRASWELLDESEGHRNPDWSPLPAALRRKPGDFVRFTGLCCSEAVWRKLEPHISEDAEGLPVIAGDKTFYILNVLLRDGLVDIARSEVIRMPDGSIFDVIKPVFYEERLGNMTLFRARETRMQIYCTEAFKVLYESLGLKDLEFHVPTSALSQLANFMGVKVGPGQLNF